ncbi:Peptidyl-prolyl cis-trans isomerase FKBP65 [Abeliophyllum distichum]|uniref:peptidylprolyl isomerase n=1 Tax=Abeliophyllum distichum TaxID=126358 RepID=A0ABD1R0T7_9LAMI
MAESHNTAIFLETEAEVSGLPEKSIGTKGLLKRILQKGNSWQTPIPGDEVKVHYSVRLQDGNYIDSSRDKGTPFVFKLGQCEVIKGCDEGIATMRKGERAVFTIPPDLAYGDAGSPPSVPPNSTLSFDVELISWNPIRDITGDGGILKKITREGDGWATPNDADEVLVKYEARCENGAVIAKSDGLEFSLNNGHLCSAMSKAVKTMRKGEKAELSVKFSYGLRHCENGTSMLDGVPPYSNLIINLELISWRSVIDVMGDNTVLKKIMKLGEGFDRPSEGSRAKVIYVSKLEDGTVISRKGSDEEPFEYTCSEGKIEEGLDRAVMTMKKGEEAIVKISSDFYYGCDVVKINSAASVLYEIKLVDFTKDKPFWKMEIQERMEACERRKHEGNMLFKTGKFQLASKNDEEKLQANSLRMSCYLNNAACKLKLGEYLEVSSLCTKVLELDSLNVKALFRRSQAYMSTSDLEKAEEDIKRALAIDPKNKDLKLKHKELKDKQRHYLQEEAKIFSTMISRIR